MIKSLLCFFLGADICRLEHLFGRCRQMASNTGTNQIIPVRISDLVPSVHSLGPRDSLGCEYSSSSDVRIWTAETVGTAEEGKATYRVPND
jgi:hypothetical protein